MKKTPLSSRLRNAAPSVLLEARRMSEHRRVRSVDEEDTLVKPVAKRRTFGPPGSAAHERAQKVIALEAKVTSAIAYTDGPTCDFIVDGLKDEAVASEVQDSALWRLMGLRISATLDELFTMFKCFSSMWDPAKTREPLMHKRYHLLVRVRELMRARLSGEAAR
eukprot:Hpha_TRINITY_DN14067_c0_g2::TRINITY_DN14067_c0_g2_i1::g.43852::m.43852